MKLLGHYLKDHLRIFVGCGLFLLCATFVIWLYNLPLGAVAYTGIFSTLVVTVLVVIPDFIRYCKKAALLSALEKNVLSTLEMPALLLSFPEENLAQISGLLCEQLREVVQEHEKKQSDMIEYYTLWVHQIKTPLSALRLLLQSQPGSLSQPIQQELFKVERYVDMVLGYLRLDTMNSDLRLENCFIYQIAKSTVKKFAPLFIYQKLTLEFEEFPDTALTDEKWLSFVLEQLLSNALKYTKKGTITLRIAPGEQLILEDTGLGIAPEDLPRIFQRGFTGYNGRQNKTSSGLGLYLVKRVLDKLGHQITIESQLGVGTKVTLILHRKQIVVY